ncbi:ATP-binding SpoIIE family protein phosphatase [Sphaerisporangium fuscum]|uniref:ATP-binding SpoIIE family protein phosphatase n=1 Tax=Sphaerisporangium fuscum TaxID=2835868 RepID=UPI001BDBD696|nr:SpoIIE family protein phosphatase [Sphaerisporangium fuscum]
MRRIGIGEGSILYALRRMSDGFLLADSHRRIIFANGEARRLLGSWRRLLGRPLWDVLAPVCGVDLKAVHEQAEKDGLPVDVDVRWPSEQRWYRIRIGHAGTCLTVYVSDVTDRRGRQAEHLAFDQRPPDRTTGVRELTMALADALTVQNVVDAVAEHVLPAVGATGLIVSFVVGGRLLKSGVVGYDKKFMDVLPLRTFGDEAPFAEVLRTRTPIFIGSPQRFVELYPNLAYISRLGNKKSWAFLPLIASGHDIGSCVISFALPRRFTSEERILLTAISGLMAQAFERARLYDAEHIRAQALQRGLLPRGLPVLPALTAAARYLPAGKDMEVGGDWYDVIPLSSGRVALVIGDVMGHGVAEAVTMGRLRTAVHTLADLEMPPDELLTHLNDTVSDLGEDFYATCLYIVYDPASNTCAFARAGHPPFAVVRPDGTVHFPAAEPNPPLGAATPPFDVTELDLTDGSLLVLYTDGLVKSVTPDIDQGLAELAHALAEAEGPDRDEEQAVAEEGGDARLELLCDALTGALLPGRYTSDDAALLVALVHPLSPRDVAVWQLPENARAAGEARELIRDQLATWELYDLSTTTELLASELVGNVVRHAKGPIQLRLLRSDVLTCEVSDGSSTTPRLRRTSETDEGGRGLQLVAALSQRWGTRYTPTGKCIWTEQPLPVTG